MIPGSLMDQPLRHLDAVREPSFMRGIFEKAIPGRRIREIALLHVRYKPGKSCLVSYRVAFAPRAGMPPADQVFSARIYPPGISASRFVKAQRARLAAPAVGEPVFHVSDLDAVVWAFPNDRKLVGLASLADEGRIAREVAPALVREAAGPNAVIRDVRHEIVQYVPEHGCTVRVTARLESGCPIVFYGKTYPGDGGEETYRNMQALWDGEARRSGSLHIAQPLAYDPETRTLWQSAVNGPTLAALEGPGPGFLSLLALAGRAVAALHRSPAPELKPAAMAEVQARLQEAGARLRRARPALAGRVSSLVAQLLERAEPAGERPAATLHGDLHWKNVVFTGSGAGLIDLDNLRAGDPLQDLGSFLASTCARGVVHGMSASRTREMAAAVLRGYEPNVPWEAPRALLRWHMAAALVSEQAYRTVVRLKERRMASLDGLLDLAGSALAGAEFGEEFAA